MMCRSVVVALSLLVGSVLVAGPAAAKPARCGGRFLSSSPALMTLGSADGGFVVAELAGDAGTLTVTGCGPTRARVKRKRKVTSVSARWAACGGSPLRLTATLPTATCATLVGKVRRPKQEAAAFEATLSACGDQRLDTAGGEACDASAASGDAACPGACRAAGATGACTWDPRRVVTTTQGQLCGGAVAGAYAFQGIGYASPPTGALRWRAPQAAPAWTGIRSARAPGNSCPQDIPVLNSRIGNEDCLYLNVRTPDPTPTALAPVMVWIHGGGFTSGDGGQYTGATEGAEIVRTGGVVVVSINYRLGPLGFLAHAGLSQEDPSHPSSGNYGLEDQIAALTWVRDHIAAFGGDPNQVTIFGESAGGWSVCAHLASPRSAGLFHRAIVQSGICTIPLTALAASEAQGDTFATRAGCAGTDPEVLACLRQRTATEIMNALPPDPNFAFTPGTWGTYGLVNDGYVFTEDLRDALAAGRFNKVPVMVGSTRDEGTLFVTLAHDNRGAPLQPSEYPARLAYLMASPAAAAVAAHYPLANYPVPGAALADAFGSAVLACPTIKAAHLMAPHTPTYLYQFEYPDAAFPVPLTQSFALGAFHSAEIQFIFGIPAGAAPFSADETSLSGTMMRYWTRFARTGDPNGPSDPIWPPFQGSNMHLVLDRTVTTSSGAKQADCDFYDSIDYLRPPLQ
jgi:para-nitrobenzyl esterase